MSDFVGDRQCVTHHACECIMARAKTAEAERDALLQINEDAVIAAASSELLRDCDGDRTLAKLRWVDNGEAEEWVGDARETVRAYLAALAASVSKEEARDAG